MAIMVNASFTKLLKLSAPHRSRPALDARSAVISPPANLTGITSPREPGGSDAPMLQRDGKCIAPGTCSEMPAPQEEVRCWIGTAGRGLSDVCTTLIIENGARAAGSVPNRGALRKRVMWAT